MAKINYKIKKQSFLLGLLCLSSISPKCLKRRRVNIHLQKCNKSCKHRNPGSSRNLSYRNYLWKYTLISWINLAEGFFLGEGRLLAITIIRSELPHTPCPIRHTLAPSMLAITLDFIGAGTEALWPRNDIMTKWGVRVRQIKAWGSCERRRLRRPCCLVNGKGIDAAIKRHRWARVNTALKALMS